MTAIEFHRILCPINFADGSRRTIEGASILAAMHDAELRLFHVVSDGQRTCHEDHRDPESLISSLFALTRTLPQRTRVSAALAFGDPASEIIRHASVMRADLIVLGSERCFPPVGVLGTISAEIATHARCPVLYVRPHLLPSLSDKAPGFAEILCCLDAISGENTHENYAHAIAHRGHVRVTLLNVVGDDTGESAFEATADLDPSRNVVQVSLTGQPGPEIVALARQVRADLIVVGAHDHPLAEHALGSTTTHVMVHAPCPVLVIPRASSRFHLPSNDVELGETRGFLP